MKYCFFKGPAPGARSPGRFETTAGVVFEPFQLVWALVQYLSYSEFMFPEAPSLKIVSILMKSIVF